MEYATFNLLFEGSHKRDWYLTVVASGTGYSFNSDPVFVLLVVWCTSKMYDTACHNIYATGYSSKK